MLDLLVRGSSPREDTWPLFSSGMPVAVLDEVDYPMLLVTVGMAVLHANKAALRRLHDEPMRVSQGSLVFARAADRAALARAVDGACRQGLRALIRIGDERAGRTAVAVVPLQLGHGRTATLLTLARARVCEELSIHCHAQQHGLTAAEARVLGALCIGHSPNTIARSHGVALSTVRSQISSLRAKTGAGDIGELVRQVVVLPPLVNALRPTERVAE
jgi:DNA-binding CsgD family transcriptional regulator